MAQSRAFLELLQRAAAPDRLDWQPLRPGVEFHALYGRPGQCPAGTLLVSPPGSRHAVVSDQGCLVLAIWAGPLEFAAAPRPDG